MIEAREILASPGSRAEPTELAHARLYGVRVDIRIVSGRDRNGLTINIGSARNDRFDRVGDDALAAPPYQERQTRDRL